MQASYHHFLTQQLPLLLQSLAADRVPKFGIMTPQHMVEHLTWVTKATPKRRGEPAAEPNKSQLYFRRFIDKGAPFEHRPKAGITVADLQPLRSADLASAIAALEKATAQFYELAEKNPAHVSYNDMMGAFNLHELELFLYQHGRWHAYQFGLIETFGNDEIRNSS